MGQLARKRTIRLDRGGHAMRLGRKHDLVESTLLEMLYKLERRGDELLRLR